MSDQNWLQHFIKEDLYPIQEKSTRDEHPPAVKEETVEVANPEKETTSVVAEETLEYTFHELAIWVPAMSESDKAFIHNIIKAVNKTPEDFQIMEGLESYQPNYGTLISFGYQKELELKLDQKLPLNQLIKTANRTILVTQHASELKNNKSEKMLLWGALKKLFKV